MRVANPNNWPRFLFTIAARFVFGAVLGGLACLIFTWKSSLWAFSHDDNRLPLIWLGLCGLVGGIVAVSTVPRRRTPWYKEDSAALDLMSELASPGRDWTVPGANVVRESVSIKIVGDDGQERVYSSMEDVPPEIRSKIEALAKEAAQEKGSESSTTTTSRTGNSTTSTIIHQKKVSLYKFVDDSGVERTYHSLEEMPPEIRAAILEAQNKSGS